MLDAVGSAPGFADVQRSSDVDVHMRVYPGPGLGTIDVVPEVEGDVRDGHGRVSAPDGSVVLELRPTRRPRGRTATAPAAWRFALVPGLAALGAWELRARGLSWAGVALNEVVLGGILTVILVWSHAYFRNARIKVSEGALAIVGSFGRVRRLEAHEIAGVATCSFKAPGIPPRPRIVIVAQSGLCVSTQIGAFDSDGARSLAAALAVKLQDAGPAPLNPRQLNAMFPGATPGYYLHYYRNTAAITALACAVEAVILAVTGDLWS